MEDKIIDGIFMGAILTIIILRLFEVITWPWLWILAPLWLSLGIGIVLAVILFAIIIIRRAWRDDG